MKKIRQYFLHSLIIFFNSLQNLSPLNILDLLIEAMDIFLNRFSSLINALVLDMKSSMLLHKYPFLLSSIISFCPPALNTTGTQPDPIASTVEIPKCSAFSGYFCKYSPYPVACQ